MNRSDFMQQLESLLQNISPAEREEALQYYNDYFDDAGPESESDVLEALGNPAKVAESIKRDLSGGVIADPLCSEEDGAVSPGSSNKNAVVKYQESENEEKTKEKSEGLPTWAVVLIVILCILASPAALGIGTGVLGTLVGLAATWFALILAFGLISVVFFTVLIALFAVGVICLFSSPLTGLALIGGGLVFAGFGILFMMLTVAMAGIATPAIIKGIVNFCKKHFRKKDKKEVAA